MSEVNPPAARKWHLPNWLNISIAVIFILGTALRLIDLTDPPLDYFPQRQLRGAIIARSIYYDLLPSADPITRNKAAYLASIMDVREPSVFEGLVAATYLISGGEHLWVARIYSILFWLLGGVALYSLAHRLTSPLAALAPLIYYFFLPWSVIFSRIFQPDILMVVLTIWVAYTLYRWGEAPSWKWAITTGVISGLAIFTKLPAIFPIALMFAGVVFSALGFRKAIKSTQAWVMLLLMLVPAAIYYLLIIPGISGEWLSFTLQIVKNIIQPSFYIRWIIFTGGLVDLGIAILSFAGIWLLPKKARLIPLGLWVGYFLYGLAFSYHITTHEYYSIPLIPAIALSLAPVAGLVFNRIKDLGKFSHWALAGILVFSIAYSGWMGRSILLSKNYRGEPAGWIKLGQELPQEGNMIGITHEQGYRIAYYGWRQVVFWPLTPQDEATLANNPDPSGEYSRMFENAIQGQSYFIVTMFADFDAQPMLKAYLYEHYPIYSQGDGYLIFDLTRSKASAP